MYELSWLSVGWTSLCTYMTTETLETNGVSQSALETPSSGFDGALPFREYVLVVVDYYSCYFKVDILKSVTSANIIDFLERIICTHGLPHSLKTVTVTSSEGVDYRRN